MIRKSLYWSAIIATVCLLTYEEQEDYTPQSSDLDSIDLRPIVPYPYTSYKEAQKDSFKNVLPTPGEKNASGN